MSKQLLIPEELFLDLLRWHLLDYHDPAVEARIRAGLQDKLNKSLARVEYGRSLPKPVEKDSPQ